MIFLKKCLGLAVSILMLYIPFSASAEGLNAYAGIGMGIPVVTSGSSSLGFKIFGGAKAHEFPVSNAGSINLYIQGEYVDFGRTNYTLYSVTSSSVSADAVGTWVIPKKWAGWADEKLAVIVKLGGAIVSENWSYGNASTTTGLARGVGAEYRFIPAVGVNVMHEQYPGYSLLSASGVFHF